MALRPLAPGVPAWLWLVLFISFNATVNLVGIGLTARVNRYMLLVELATLALFVGFGLAALYGGAGAGRLTWAPLYNSGAFSWATMAGATSVAVLSFLGFDGISTLAEENGGRPDAIARATVLSLLLVGALFMLQTWIATDLAHGMKFSSSETAFYDIVQRAGGPWLKLITIVAVVLALAIANAMAAQHIDDRYGCHFVVSALANQRTSMGSKGFLRMSWRSRPSSRYLSPRGVGVGRAEYNL